MNRRPIQSSFRVGKVKHLLDFVYKSDDVLRAYRRILTGRARGKVVVSIS